MKSCGFSEEDIEKGIKNHRRKLLMKIYKGY